VEIIIPDVNMAAILPQIILTLGACLVLLLGVFLPASRRALAYVSAIDRKKGCPFTSESAAKTERPLLIL